MYFEIDRTAENKAINKFITTLHKYITNNDANLLDIVVTNRRGSVILETEVEFVFKEAGDPEGILTHLCLQLYSKAMQEVNVCIKGILRELKLKHSKPVSFQIAHYFDLEGRVVYKNEDIFKGDLIPIKDTEVVAFIENWSIRLNRIYFWFMEDEYTFDYPEEVKSAPISYFPNVEVYINEGVI